MTKLNMIFDLITRNALKNLAGATVFSRGEDYFSSDSVTRLKDNGKQISARVEGTEIYRVKLWDDGGELACECTCPHWAEGFFCKHCVAVGLAWLAGQSAEDHEPNQTKKKRKDPWQGIRDYLALQNQETLIRLVLESAERDSRLYQTLLLKAERSAAGGNLPNIFRKAIDKATRIRDFVDWREAGDFGGNLEQLTESLQELLTPESAGVLVELTEYAIERVENAMQNVDDSNGEVGGVDAELGDLHLRACKLARPEPEALAERLFRLEMTLPMGICSFSATTYAEVLGEKGLSRYRELAETQWRTIKPKESGDPYDARVGASPTSWNRWPKPAATSMNSLPSRRWI